MGIKLAINGFGRIGRCVLRAIQDDSVEVVAINDLTDAKTLAHLLKYDSVHGRYHKEVSYEEGAVIVGGKRIPIYAERDPSKLPWKQHGVDIVLEATGVFRTGPKTKAHIDAGAKKVIISAPGKDIDATFVMGVNHETYDPAKHNIVSNASCTTNCLAPIVKVLNDSFGIEHGLMTTIHSVTNDQRILDLPHEDLRRARAAYESMIPTTTGAAAAVGLVLPELKGKLNGFAIRVPTKDVSVVDFVAHVKRDTTIEEVNKALEEAAKGSLAGFLATTRDEPVSIDFIGNPASSTADLGLTEVMAGHMVKVVSWYDNEWGYSSRCVDLVKYMGARL